MSKIKDLQRVKINKAALSYLCDQDEGDLYDAYMVLMDESDKGNGKYTANSYVTVWQPLEHKTVDELIDLIDSNVCEMEVPEFIKTIDWVLLCEQKQSLLTVIDELENTGGEQKSIDGLNGILHLIDNLQEYAVDTLGIDENLVINLHPDEENEDFKDECTVSIWSEIRSDFEEQYMVYIDAYLTPDDNENGQTIAKVNTITGNVQYIDERAKTDAKAQEAINEILKMNRLY